MNKTRTFQELSKDITTTGERLAAAPKCKISEMGGKFYWIATLGGGVPPIGGGPFDSEEEAKKDFDAKVAAGKFKLSNLAADNGYKEVTGTITVPVTYTVAKWSDGWKEVRACAIDGSEELQQQILKKVKAAVK